MSYGDNNKHFEHLKLPVTWTVMGLVAVICVGAALMFLGDRRGQDEATAYGNRSGFDAAAGPVNNVLSWPVHKMGDGTNWIDDYFFAVRENRLLKKKVAELNQYRDAYTELKDLNTRYESLLKLRTDPPVDMVTARSVSVSRGPFANNRLINSGSQDGIRFDNPVITDQGLIGRVVGISAHVSRVLMVTDISSHVPIMILRSDGRAMMSGDGGGYPKLEWVRGKDTVRPGDQVLTSGDGGVFPRGLPVGETVKGVDGVWRVRLYANRAPIDFVKVLLYKDFSQLPNADTLLRTPSISDLLPPPPLPQVAGSSAAASGSAASHAAVDSAPEAAKPSPAVPAHASPAPVAPVKTPVAPKPAVPHSSASASAPRPSASKPAASKAASGSASASHHAASEALPVTPELKPFVPPASAGQE
ncbi:rod shape-determining protein MreC [Asticcacaulis sp. EMRT-3]|uniref:rod shape-determining protein MreC n=1 Tax=Asticcacaulis sp. EMRT-3 TaxID=3040349 RepID=UPI0024AF67B0|nr:rod shape-determining protein MreC [Asticcacaulis sp. EMRT-3]MDI7775210.1 rod shape-determining protein MreC [Asticcacaulis sp. EMRT-3]